MKKILVVCVVAMFAAASMAVASENTSSRPGHVVVQKAKKDKKKDKKAKKKKGAAKKDDAASADAAPAEAAPADAAPADAAAPAESH